MSKTSNFSRSHSHGVPCDTNRKIGAAAAANGPRRAATTPDASRTIRLAKCEEASKALISEKDRATEPRESIIDKLVLVLPISAVPHSALEAIAERLSEIPNVKRITSKGDTYQKRFVLACPSTTKIVVSVLAADSRMRFGLKIVMNPAHMTLKDTSEFVKVLAKAFMPEPKATLGRFLIQRVDHAYDYPVPINDLVVQAAGSPVEEKYFVSSDSKSRIQTWYCGSIESQERFISYDQVDSDEFKAAHGEMPSRPSARANAEVVLDKGNVGPDMTRFESRRVFRKPLTLAEVDAKPQPFGRFNIYVLDQARVAKAPPNFTLYLDSVRLRGVNGARKNFLKGCPGRAAKTLLADLEQYLRRCMAPWWDVSVHPRQLARRNFGWLRRAKAGKQVPTCF